MPSLKNRIAALEGHTKTGSDDAHSAAYGRIFVALREALIPLATARDISAYQAGDSVEELIKAMHARMHTCALNDDDRHVLASLPAEDMALTHSSPESVVEVLARLYGDY